MILLYSRNYMYEAGIRGNYHESSDCFNFEYPPPPPNPCLLIKLPKNSTCQNFPTRKSPEIENFKPPKILPPPALSLEIRSTPPPPRHTPDGSEMCVSFRELHVSVLEPKTGYFAIVVCSLRIAIEWLN